MKRIFVLSSLVAGFSLNAQSIGNSPYGAYGIGDVKYDNTVDVNAMGGISTAYVWDFNNSFNFRNPAANTNLELTTLKVEGTNENNYYSSDFNNLKNTKHSTYLSNISIAFPISRKVKFGFGFQPYSSKSYDIVTSKVLPNSEITQVSNFHGEGSINTIQAALSYQITPAFALGLRSNFYFGKLYDIEEVAFTGAELISGYSNSYRVKAFNFTLGTTYQKKLANDHKLTAGATYTIGNSGNMKSTYTNSTYYYLVGETHVDVGAPIEEKVSYDKKFLPQEGSLGVGYGKDTKWFLGTQLDYKKGENFNFLGSTLAYQDSYKYSVGGWWLPNFNNFRSYFSRIIYRYGAYYEKGNLQINGTNINKYAITGGVTLPFQKSTINRMSSLDLGIEVGKRGTLENNMIRQNFVNLRIGVNFADKWFAKRLYN